MKARLLVVLLAAFVIAECSSAFGQTLKSVQNRTQRRLPLW
jgi:hypothetical protein